MKALFGSCFPILFTSILGLKGAPIDSKILILNEDDSPQLFYLGFQKYKLVKNPFSFGKSTLHDVWDADNFFSPTDNSLQHPFIASFPCSILLNELSSEAETGKAVAINANHYTELNMAIALNDFEIRKAAKIKIGAEKKAKVARAESISGKKTFFTATLPSLTPSSPGLRIGELVSYFVILSGFLLILFGLHNSILLSNQSVSKQRIIIARRKRWLQKLARYGIINQATLSLLLEQIKAKDWELRLKKTTRYSELLEPDDIIGDLSNRNNGESVVKIRDISLPKTSR